MSNKLFGLPLRQALMFGILATTLLFASFTLANIISGIPTTGASQNVTYTQLAINRPTVAEGDLMLASIAVNGGSAINVTAPSGWTLVSRTDNDINIALITYWKFASASEPSNYIWTINSQTRAVGGITPYSGVASPPIDSYAANTGFGNIPTAAPSTASATNEEVVSIFATDVSKNFSTPTGQTEKYQLSNGSLGPTIASSDAIQAASGAVGSKSSTISGNKSRFWASQQIVLRRPTTPTIMDSLPISYHNAGNPILVNGDNFTYIVPTGGANKILLVQLCLGAGRIPSASQNGVEVTLTRISGSSTRCDHWYGTLANPTSGTFLVSWTGDSAGVQYAVMTLQDVNIGSPVDSANVATQCSPPSTFNSLSTNLTTTQGNDLLLDEAVGSLVTTHSYGPAQTEIHSTAPNEPAGEETGSQKLAGLAPGVETMTRNFTPGDNCADLAAIAIKGN